MDSTSQTDGEAEREAGESGTSTGTAQWHARSTAEVLAEMDTTEGGLTRDEASRRLEEYGPNEIRRGEEVSPLAIFVSQFRDFLIYLLVIAAILSLAVGIFPDTEPNYVDAGLILLILLANGVFGFVQDYRAEQSMEELRKMATPDATVFRDGEKVTVDAREVVPGDVVFVDQGDAVPADARLIRSSSLETIEAALTGESATVAKGTDPVDPETSLAERSNMVYMNTSAVRGHGRAVVVGTGMDTEVGGIATQIREAEEEKSPFQREVDDLGRRIGYGILVLIVLVAVVQFLLTDANTIAIGLTAITLAVAAVPEGLPAVVTLTLALGSRRMMERNALVRRLPVVESLGSVNVIVTDKTGTLTENQMTVRRIATGDEVYEVSGSGLSEEGEFTQDGDAVDPGRLERILRCGAVCNNAEKAPASEDTDFYGDPTEVALLLSAAKAGIGAAGERLREVPFSSERKLMTVVVSEESGPTGYTKGAPEEVLERCDRVLIDGEIEELTDERRDAYLDRNESFARDALRVLGFAFDPDPDTAADEADLEDGLVFLGLQGMIDPPREEVASAVADCRNAGIRVVMVTGDNLATAQAVGEAVGFDPEGALTGREVESMSEERLREVVEEVEVFARVAPDHKVRILQALQANGHDVAMTGDGVNDAPALRNADVGVSMGVRGTDVAQEASDMVLQDDNFVTIRDAIAEGRGIFDNIRKFVNLLLSANTGEVLVVFFGVLVGSWLFPDRFAGSSEALILTPVMLLWINVVTDGLPALALGVDPRADGILDREPRSDDEPVIDRQVVGSILSVGAIITLTGLPLFFHGLSETGDLVFAQTLLFTFIVVVEMVVIQIIRTRYELSPVSNPWLVGAVGTSLALQLLVLYTPANAYFDVRALSTTGWTWILAAVAGFTVLSYAAEKAIERTID